MSERVAKAKAAAKLAEHHRWLKLRTLKSYLVLPGQIRELQDFQHVCREVTNVEDEADYAGFVQAGHDYVRKVRGSLFWRETSGTWGRLPITGPERRRRQVQSPYLEDYLVLTGVSADHSRGSADGANTWLDRFVIATDELVRAFVRVKRCAQLARLVQGADEPVDPQLLTALTALKAEYAAVYALSLYSPETRIPDPSLLGRDPVSKWFANGGTFVVWSAERDGYVPLSDRQGARAELLRMPDEPGDYHEAYVDRLKLLEMTLVNLPVDFGDFDARTAAKVARLDAELVRLVAVVHVAEGATSPFHPPVPTNAPPRRRVPKRRSTSSSGGIGAKE